MFNIFTDWVLGSQKLWILNVIIISSKRQVLLENFARLEYVKFLLRGCSLRLGGWVIFQMNVGGWVVLVNVTCL